MSYFLLILIYRLGHKANRFGLPWVGALLTATNRIIFSCYIPCSSHIGRAVKFGYCGLGVVIHSRAIIGDHCWIMQNVTIGKNLGDPGVPRLGRNVVVGAGAVIMGDVEIGDDCVIGANSVVRTSFPPRSVIAGVPAKLIRTISEDQVKLHYDNR